jgi:nitrogen-specific signal transduction histidine kinase/CheY-like chemotaxis protein
MHDITEQKRLETEIIKAKKLEATALLAGGIAHDFNNLLAVILGNLEMAQEDITLGRPFSKKLLRAKEACLRAGDLTKKFLTFSSGGEPFKKPTPVEGFLSDAVTLALAGTNVSFECSFAADLWPVDIDAGQMTLALGNVITNAREAMPQGGVIRIRAENAASGPDENRELLNGPKSRYVKVSIQDYGKGIPGDVLPQVFDPYFSSKDTWQNKGLGLGLTIAYSIIKKHGGHIDIASKPNVGTTVTLYLPASDKEIVQPADKAGQPPAVNKKILFMDDEEMLRNVTRDILKMLGCEVEVAGNGEEAIQLYAKARQAGAPFGAVILDLTIKGGMGGKETLQHLKEIDPDVRAIVASGYANDPVMSNFREYGFLDALPKPYQLKDLVKSLRAVTGFCGMLPSRKELKR